MPDPETIAALATQPISEGQPTGESVRYDDAFGQVEAEVGKLENPAGGEVDWRVVSDGCGEILRSKAKDLLVAAWLVRSWYEREGLPGLHGGLVLLKDLVGTFWEGIHPERLRPRRAALEWLGDKLAIILDPEVSIEHDPAAIEACLAVVEDIITWSDGKFEGEDCGLLGLRRNLRGILERIQLNLGGGEAPADSEAAAEAGGTVAAPAGGGRSIPVGPIANRAAAIARLRELGDWFTANEPHSPIGLLIRKAERWSRMSFEEVFQQLLRKQSDAQEHVWDVLGIEVKEEEEG